MDIARSDHVRRRHIRRVVYVLLGITSMLLVGLGLSRLEPATPVVERSTLWIDTVKRGSMVREVRGTGALVPEITRWIPATTAGRVERIRLQPGVAVNAASVILELSNPQLEQELEDAALKLKAVEANLANLRVQLQNELLQQQGITATVETDYKKALMQVEVNEQLAAKSLLPPITLKQSKLDADQLAARFAIAQKQLASQADSMRARLAMQDSEVEQASAVLRLRSRQVEELRVRAVISGVLQVVPIEVGQQVTVGMNLARVADPSRLKAELKISETQAKDMQIGQRVTIDTRNGLVSGTVARIDPSVQNGTVTVDVVPSGPWPKGARPDLSVDGTIELERLDDVLFVGRPASAEEHSLLGLFKVRADGRAARVQVRIGRSSVNAVEVTAGLTSGDQVILSDTSAWTGYDEIQVR